MLKKRCTKLQLGWGNPILLAIQRSIQHHKMRWIYGTVFLLKAWGGIDYLFLYLPQGATKLPPLRHVVAQLAAEKDNPYCVYFSGGNSSAWKNKDFLAIYNHPNVYIEEVIAFLYEPNHTIKEHLMLQHMMELLSSLNYTRFLEACTTAYLAGTLSTRMLAEMAKPIRWDIRQRDGSWRPGYFLTHAQKPKVQEILVRIQQNIDLPIFFKTCIADVATGKTQQQLIWEAGGGHQPLYFLER